MKTLDRRSADKNHDVVTIVADDFRHCPSPCAECPWRRDSPIGAFPAEAYRISAKTAYDMGESTFACHMAGAERSAVCAGFLLRGADHNLAVRLARATGKFDPESVSDSGLELYDSYRDMAEANGVAPDDPALEACR